MVYATLSDLIARFGEAELIQLTDTTHRPPTTVDELKVEVALSDASIEIDGYVGMLYRMPLAGCLKPAAVTGDGDQYVPPPLLVRLCCDLARAMLYSTFLPVEHEVSQRRTQALATLEQISKGKVVLSCPWGGEPGEVLGSTAQTQPDLSYSFSSRSVTDDGLAGF